ncbi:MAG: DNA mismatch repair endonuclease MutL [Bacteroidetes bacterium]|nr:DNA mismatch repair endonuclease MutL [Bacteroidota bacterium]
MPDIIQLLPDSVANQIAAGEVIQRPASVVKELIENAVDAGSTQIRINIRDAGRTLIQVVDNGCGMSETDARLAFERHATSKIKKAEDLFAIHTMGFRGEALASVAAVAHVELRTKRVEDDTGILIRINGSEVEIQEPCSCTDGCNFMIKNLFFNVPARRKFLKSNTTELRCIIEEVQRVAFAHPDIAFHLIHNESEIYNLPAGNLKQRIVSIIGKNRNQNLVTIQTDTSIARIEGFIGKPEHVKRKSGEQYFFVNKRYMRHYGFNKAVMKAYEKIIPPETYPSFFIYLTVDPETIDVNIHPTKTEIKFENETGVWQIILAAVKESLGKFNVVPSLDFDTEPAFDIPILKKGTEVRYPEITINPEYNPFEENTKVKPKYQPSGREKDNTANWQKLFNGFEKNDEHYRNEPGDEERQLQIKHDPGMPCASVETENASGYFFQFKNRYIMTPVKSGLMIIDQKRAHERILFEKFLINLGNRVGVSQKSLYPVTMELNPQDFILVQEMMPDLKVIGFDIDEFGRNSIVINGIPSDCNNAGIPELIESFIEIFKTGTGILKAGIHEQIAFSMAKAASVRCRNKLTNIEMRELVDQLFACTAPNYTPDGKPAISILSHDELEKRFK